MKNAWITTIVLGTVGVALGLGLGACQPQENMTSQDTITSAVSDYERVAFTADHDGATLSAWLAKPDGDGPFPAVVLQHGCFGLDKSTPYPTFWPGYHATVLNNNGYATLLVDSFGPRGITNACQDVHSYYPVLIRDADSAFDYLASLPFVDRDRIGYTGFSLGGVAALFVASDHSGDLMVRRDYAAVVAYYPHCGNWSYYSFDRQPLLIMIGAADDWTPATPCRELAAHWSDQVQLIVYPNAHHGFDSPTPYRTQHVGDDGSALSIRTNAADPKAHRDSQRRMLTFFAQHLRPAP